MGRDGDCDLRTVQCQSSTTTQQFTNSQLSKDHSHEEPTPVSSSQCMDPRLAKNTVKQLFRRAKDLERKGQWRKAAGVLREILHLDPSDSHSHLALARLEARRDPFSSAAVAAFAKGTATCPTSIHLWQAWAVHEEAAGRTDKARDLFERALQLDPFNPYVCHAYGRMELLKAGNAGAARQLWERALEKSSTAALVCSLGELLISKKEYDQARDLYVRHVNRVETDRERTEIYLADAWLAERYFGNCDQAQELIKLSLASSPTSSVAQIALARLEGRKQMKHKGEELGVAMAKSLAKTCKGSENTTYSSQPADGRVYNAWASTEVKARRFSAARKILRKGLERYPRDHSLLQAAGKIEERLGNYTGARDLYCESLRIQPSAPCLVAFAILELKHPESGHRNLTRAVRLFEEALLLDPKHGPAYNAFARYVFQYTGDERKSRDIYQRGIQMNCPDAASIYHGYARLELSLGNVDRARELLIRGKQEVQRQDAGKDYPHRERALFLTHTLGMLELNRNDPSSALNVFMDGIQHYGNSSQLLLGAALCEVKLGNQEKARVLFERSVLRDQKHAHAWQAWAVMEMRAGNVGAARTLFECGIKSSPRHGALWQAFATMESRLGDVSSARDLFETGIKKAPKHIPLYQSWAFMELREGNFTAAKALIAQALTRDKRNGAGWLIAAEIEERLENSGLATLLLRRGIECAPTQPELYRALGDLLVRKGKVVEAREIFEQGMKVDPRHAPLYHSLAELEARLFNVEGLARLHKQAALIFSANVLEPPASSSEVWGTRILAKRSRRVPEGVTALAQKIVEDDCADLTVSSDDAGNLLLDQARLLEDDFIGGLLVIEDEESLCRDRFT